MKKKPARFRTRVTDLRTAEHNPSARYALTFSVDGHTVTYDLGNARALIDAAIYKLEAAETLVADDQKRRRARAEARRKVRAQHAQLREAAEAAVSDQKPAPVPTATRPAGSPHAAAHEPQGGRRQHPSAVALGQGMDSITLAKVSAESNGGD